MTDSRERLLELAREIRAIMKDERGQPAPSILPSLGNWFAGAVYDYLRRRKPLEVALGLRPGRGGRPPKKVVPEHARELSETKSQESWLRASDELKRNQRTLQRSKSRYEKRLDAQKNAEISAKIIEKLKKADAARILARRSRLVIPPK